MENTLTEIAVVLNRSGSMESARTDTIGGFNTFLAEQVDDAGDVNRERRRHRMPSPLR
ncbi:MAG: hypothetical protein INH10_17675 [Rhodocyclaceae bacterium]|nr:hypothetical protein [Rhodocyclaceae bacterium]